MANIFGRCDFAHWILDPFRIHWFSRLRGMNRAKRVNGMCLDDAYPYRRVEGDGRSMFHKVLPPVTIPNVISKCYIRRFSTRVLV